MDKLLQKHNDLPRATSPAGATDDVARLELHVHGAFSLPNIELAGTIDPYVVVTIGGGLCRRTSTITNETNPAWDEVMVFPLLLPPEAAPVRVDFQVWDDNFTKNELISSAAIEIPGVLGSGGGRHTERLQVVNLLRPKGTDGGLLRYSLVLASVERLEARARALAALERIPLLPSVVSLLARAHALVAGWRALALEDVHDASLLGALRAFCTAPFKVATGFVRSVLRGVASFIL